MIPRAASRAVIGGVAGLLALAAGAVAATPLWPEMRHDLRNTGTSPIVARYRGARPWTYFTNRGIFSTPIIGTGGTIYVGSADHYFYALSPAGRLRFRIRTGGIIDAAGAVTAGAGGGDVVTFGSGDALLYHLAVAPRGSPRLLWRFRATKPPVPGQLVDWWEGDVVAGPGGNLFAGNTGGTAYSLTPSGHLRWTYTGGNSLWTAPAFAADGSSFWGSLDLHALKLDSHGRSVWQTFTPGYVVSSPALGSDGTVYVGSFDSRLYALDPATGVAKWTFPTSDHVYASPALGHDVAGRTTAIYVGSADGSVYAVSPAGRLLWRYDTGDPIRSSPALGPAPGGGSVVYVGSSNGKLYALDARTGRRRWSYDTTPSSPALRDRNDLNASPALSRTGVVIAGEDGTVDYVPYDYCLHRRDPRCATSPGQDFGQQLDRVFPVSAGGTTMATSDLRGVSPATVFNLRLVVRRGGRTVNAAILDPQHVVSATPAFRFTVQESGDGHFLFVVPDGLLRPGTTYRLRVAGHYTDNGSRMGNFAANGPVAGSFAQTITVRTAPRTGPLPLTVGARSVSAMTIRRLAVPMPAFLPSVNQIGFDSYDWIASTIARQGSHLLLWVIGAERDARGVERVDPGSAFSFPLQGTSDGRALALSAANVPLEFSFGEVPLRRYAMRGTLGPGLGFNPGAAIYTDTVCATVPHYGAELPATGICNPTGVLAASGTFLSSGYQGSATNRPAGVRLASLALVRPGGARAGSVVARFAGAGLPNAARHVAGVLLVDPASGTPVALDYHADHVLLRDGRGKIAGVRLTIPADTALPAHVRAYVMIDAFPIGSRVL